MADPLAFFADEFSGAREIFLGASETLGAGTATYLHPDEKGLRGEDISIDACRFGPEDADVVLVTVSGTHGGEGYAGSAMQAYAMEAGMLSTLPEGVAILQIHAANPFGMSHYIRTNENNVDMNRNWIDFDNPPEKNLLYDPIFDGLPPPGAPSLDHVRTWLAAFEELVGVHGRWEVDNALTSGQYHRPDGLAYGGHGPQWSRRTLTTIFQEMLGQPRHVAYLDWHTLLRTGNGNLIFLCFNQTNDPLFERAGQWWGREAIDRETVNAQWSTGTAASARRPSRSGLMMWGVQNLLAPQADVAGAVIEFCTDPHPELSPDEMQTFEMVCEQYLQSTRDFTSPTGQEAVNILREATTPKSTAFREGVIAAGSKALGAALDGAGQWAAENVPAAPGVLQTQSAFE